MTEFKGKESSIQPFRLRPRFKIEAEIDEHKVTEGIKNALVERNGALVGSFLPSYLYIRYPKAIRKYWTPQLQVSIDPLEKDKSLLRCLIGPHAEVWTFFVFLYSFAGFLIAVGLIYGFSQLSLDKQPTGFWFLLPGVVILNMIFIASKIGQKKGEEHKQKLQEFIFDVVKHIN